MRRQTILLAAALAVAMPSAAAIHNRSDARSALAASRDPAAPTARDRLILKIKDAKTAAFSIAPADEATTFGLAPREIAPDTAGLAPQLGAETKLFAPMVPPRADFTAPDLAGYAPHVRLAPVYVFDEPQIGRVSLNVGPVLTTSYRDGDETFGGDVSGVAVGLSFKLN